MKKLLTVLISSLILIMLAACGNKVDEATADKYIGQAKGVAEDLTDGNYEDVHAQFDATMKASLSTEQMAELDPLIEGSGSFEKFDKESIEEKDGNYTVVLVAEYSKENRVYTISFNGRDEIIGLFIK